MVSNYSNPSEYPRDRYARDQFERETVLPLVGAALIAIVMASLGLWWAVLSVVCPLASALLGAG